METPRGFVSSQAWIKQVPRSYRLLYGMGMGLANIKTTPEQVLRDVTQPQAPPLLMDYV